jgi:DNA-binding PadR family transcriptional regulator
MAGGPRARRGDVRVAVLALLTEGPMHGYQIIQELENRSGGTWRPSPGSIYPTLQLLADEGLVTSEEVGGKRVYSLTEAGRERAEQDAKAGPGPWGATGEGGDDPRMKLKNTFLQLGAAAMQVAQAGSDEDLTQTIDILTEARRRIYGLLADGE